MKGKLLIGGVVAIIITVICGFVFGLAQPEAPTAISWMQLAAIMQKNNGADIEKITLELLANPEASAIPSSHYPRLEVQFRKPKPKAIVSVEELRAKDRGTHCGILRARPPEIRRIEWLVKESEINRIDLMEKIVGSNYRRNRRDKFYEEPIVEDGKRTEFPLISELITKVSK